jgi:hypothetical protein
MDKGVEMERSIPVQLRTFYDAGASRRSASAATISSRAAQGRRNSPAPNKRMSDLITDPDKCPPYLNQPASIFGTKRSASCGALNFLRRDAIIRRTLATSTASDANTIVTVTRSMIRRKRRF